MTVWPYTFIIWLVTLYGVFAKSIMLQHISGYLAISRAIGRSSEDDFTRLEKLSFYREDILVSFVFSLCFAILMSVTPDRLRKWVTLVSAGSIILFYFFSIQTFSNVGTFLTPQLAMDSVHWAIEHPEYISKYVSFGSIIKLFLLIFIAVGLVYIAVKICMANRKIKSVFNKIMVVGIVFNVVLYLFSMTSPVEANSAYVSSTRVAVSNLIEMDNELNEFSILGLDKLRDRYNQLSRTPKNYSHDDLYGKAKNRDIIVLVLETSPLAGFDDKYLANPSLIFGNSKDSVISSVSHFSTYPYTSDAILSIFASIYSNPKDRRRIIRSETTMLGWPEILNVNGYITKAYSPYGDTFEDDASLYRLIGFSQRYVVKSEDISESDNEFKIEAEKIISGYSISDLNQRAQTEDVLTRDLLAWDELKSDVLNWKKNNDRFAVAFTPQIGHGPWPSLIDSKNILDQGKTISKIQIDWISDFARELEHKGYLENTVIVITGDHGLRTRAEYDLLRGGVLENVSINVPYIMYGSKLFSNTPSINYPTSHIDIGPTLLWLLGFDDTRPIVQGHMMFDQKLNDRILFGFGGSYLGADAVITKKSFVSCNSLNYLCQSSKSQDSEQSEVNNLNENVKTIRRMNGISARIAGILQNTSH
jgi:phosphoglycerol transferase MdoB-like AlkP superfamily enzyme